MSPKSLLLLSLVSWTAAAAQTPAAPSQEAEQAMLRRIYDEALAHGQAYAHLSDLVARYPYRLSGSPALTGAIDWAQTVFASMGVDRVEKQPVLVPHWERGGPESITLLASPAVELTATALGGTTSTPAGGLTAEVVEVQTLAQLRALGPDRVRGKIVFFNHAMDPRIVVPARAYGLAGIERNRGPAAAVRYGAVAALVRSLTFAEDDVPHTGTTVFPAGSPRIPAAALSTLAADRLSAALRSDPHLRIRMELHGRVLPDAPAANVIAELRGSEHPDQVLLVGGHLDCWDIAPGENDDGAGVAQSIEVLRIFQALGLRPRHTLRTVLFVNEENGSAGANAYAARVRARGERHLIALETDNGSFQPRGFTLGNLRHDAAARAARWLPLFRPYSVFYIDEGAGGADVEPLLPLGIACGETRPDSQLYFEYHHTRNDTMDHVNPRELELGAAALASLLYLVDQEGL